MPTAAPMHKVEAFAQNETSGTLFSSEPLPLPEPLLGTRLAGCLAVAAPLIDRARQRVREGARALAGSYSHHVPFNPETIEEILAEGLAEPLLMMIARTMVLELNVARLEGLLAGENPGERFESFLNRIRRPAFAAQLFAEYRVLHEQVIHHLEKWVSASLEFLEHLCADWNDLGKTFFTGDPGPLVGLMSGAGDTHRGRSVIVASFASGERLVYKPRSLAVDGHFQQLLAWLNDCGTQPAFRLLKILNRDSHGWSEFVATSTCETTEEVDRFYQRQGGYLALLYALEASDFHCENLIAAGEHPMLIDLEALFHPRFEGHRSDEADSRARSALSHSVMRVGMLPVRSWAGEDQPGVDISGLGTTAGQFTPSPMPCWEQAGTDEMRLARKRLTMPIAENRPSFHGRDVGPLDYSGSIVAGFASIYRLLAQHRAQLPAILRWFADDEVRVIVRATQTYGALLYESFHPDVLRKNVDRVALFDRLTDVSDSRVGGQLMPAERNDLLRGDIPIFTTRPASHDIWTSTREPIRDFFEHSSLAAVEHRITQLCDSDLARQSWIIRASIATLDPQSEELRIRTSPGLETKTEASRELLLAATRAIGDRLTELSLSVHDECGWIGLVCSGGQTWRISPVGPDLYDGMAGIVLFLAYAGEAFSNQRYSRLARAGLESLWRRIEDPSSLVTIGAFSGWGGIVYCLAHLGVILREPSFFVRAEQCRDRISSLLTRDRQFDVVGGAAGAILALHALYHCQPSAQTLEVIRACADYLIQSSISTDQVIGWADPSTAAPPLTGFAHGNAGIAYALLQAAALTSSGRFRDAAFQGFGYERSLFSVQDRNWPDLRAGSGSRFVNAWCHGAPGIGLSRVCSLRHDNDPHLIAEIEAALTTTTSQGFGGNHTLCHGDLGNADILLHAAETLGRPEWRVRANQVAGQTIQSAADSGWICGSPCGVESPGLMTGLAGMGYAFLRLADPVHAPSLLALDPPLLT